jgi:hypothetical protein
MQEVGGDKMEMLSDVPVFGDKATGLIDYTKIVIDDARQCAEFQFSVGVSTWVYFEKRKPLSAQICDSINMVQCKFGCFSEKVKDRQSRFTRHNTGFSDESEDLDEMLLAAREMIDNLDLYDDGKLDDVSHLSAAQAFVEYLHESKTGGSHDMGVYAGAATRSASSNPTDLFPNSGWKVTLVRPGDNEDEDDADVSTNAAMPSRSASSNPTDLFPDSAWKVTLVRPGDNEDEDDADVSAGAAIPNRSDLSSNSAFEVTILRPGDFIDSDDENVHAGAATLPAESKSTDLFSDLGWEVTFVSPRGTTVLDTNERHMHAARTLTESLEANDDPPARDEDMHAGPATGGTPEARQPPAVMRRRLSKREISGLNSTSPTTFRFKDNNDKKSAAAFRWVFSSAQQRTDLGSTKHMLKNVKEWVNFYKFCCMEYNDSEHIDIVRAGQLFETPQQIQECVREFETRIPPELRHDEFEFEDYVNPLPFRN